MQHADLLEIYTFGDVVIQWRTKATSLVLSPREELLLIYLAYQRVPVSRSQLCHLFWPDETPLRAHGNLRKLLVDVRKSMNNLIVSTREDVALHPELSYWLDVHEFQWQMQPLAQADKVSSGSHPIDLARLLYGIQLYTGEFLGHIKQPKSHVLCEWLEQAQTHLHQQVIHALKLVIERYRYDQHEAEAMHYAKRLLALDPFDEEAHEQVMLLWAAMGCLGEAVQHYQAYRQLLEKELATTPEPQLVSLYQQLRAGKVPTTTERKGPDPEVVRNADWPLPQLPKPLTPLLGRADSLQQLQQYLTDPAVRLVTLVGMGGIGKTHLALALAEQLRIRVGTQSVLVPLHDLPHRAEQKTEGQRTEDRKTRREEEEREEREEGKEKGSTQPQTDGYAQLALATAQALRLPMTAPTLRFEQIGVYLQDKPWLLIFDGFERFEAGVAFLTTLLQAAPSLKVLVTTRECLQIPGESIMVLEGLPRPTPEEMSSFFYQQSYGQAEQRVSPMTSREALTEQAPSLQLFIQCLHRQTSGLVLQVECLQDILQICHLVEGNPLAIELAAGLSSHYSWSELVERLQRHLDILSTTQRGRPQRQRSMSTVIEDSWRLLSRSEQTTLTELSIFADSFSRTAAIAITNSAPETLIALVNKSLLRSKAAGRYELPRLIRLFAAQRLHSRGCTVRDQQLQAAHARYYLSYLQQEIEYRQSLASTAIIDLLQQEVGNLLKACSWVHQYGTPEQRQQYMAILGLLRRCAVTATSTLAYGASMVWAVNPLLSLMA